ncbi:separin protein [Kalmusia sp. IMI 367209]|nr:separin protein [Kalmusia sp. IMI 367209]
MTEEKDATRTRLENIKTDLRSIATCTTTTVADLKRLLVGNSEEAQKENIRARSTKTASAQSSAHRRAGTSVATSSEDVAGCAGLSSTRERYRLATEVVNIALKSLADALKTQAAPRTVQPPPKTKPPTKGTANAAKPQRPRLGHTKSSSVSQYPLKERSVSQINNSPTKPSLRRSSSYSTFHTTGPDPGLLATTECARLAFAYLSTSEAVKIAGQASSELVLENGRLAFVGKLVAHSLDSLAIKEMRILKRRLDTYIGRYHDLEQGRSVSSRAMSRQASTAEKESLASLLDFGDVDYKSAAIPIITNLQVYVLRVIARVKRPRIVEEAWNYLTLSYSSNPAGLISHIANDPDQRARASRQLESLAQTILHLCPSISSASDEEQLQPLPDVVLCLQHLAFKVRQKWWALAQHQGDTEKDLIEPFSKCLVAFARRSTLSAVEKYKLAESLFTDLLGSGSTTQSSPPRDGNSKFTIKNSTLASLARAAQLSDQALRWLGTSASSGSEECAAAAATRSVRIAAVSLEAIYKDGSIADQDAMADAALKLLSSSIDGSTKELETLMMEVNAFRRVATRIILPSSSAPKLSASLALQQQCVRIIAASVHFANRFIGSRPTETAHAKMSASYQARFTMASKLTKSITDSVLACCRQKLTSEASWKELDLLIQDCVHFISQFDETSSGHELPNTVAQESTQSAFVKLSNAYWGLHIQLRKLNPNLITAAAAMQRSTALLQSRPQTERADGQLSSKLERLGEALDQLDHIPGSREAFQQCIQTSLDDGLVPMIVDAASCHPVLRLFESNRSLSNLGRALKLYHRSFIKYGLKNPDKLAFFDNCEYPTTLRGVLLEWQLALYQQTLSRNRAWDSSLNSSIQAMADRLRDIYVYAQYPIRRQRIDLLLLQLSRTHPDIISEVSDPEGYLYKNIRTVTRTDDRNLSRFQGPLSALYTLQTALQDGKLTTQKLQDCFNIWQSMLDSASSWDKLVDQIDNVDHWLEAIQASVDLLCAKGEEYEALPVLHLYVRVLELQKNPDPSQLIMVLCTLGLQLLRLGYSGKAGLAFAKAEILSSNEAASTEAQLRWHLGYAEYLLNIGNTKKCESTLTAAEAIARNDTQFMDLAKSSTVLSGRLIFYRVVAEACYVSSLLYSSKGDYKNAAKYARQSVILNRRIWGALESQANCRKATSPDTSGPTPTGSGAPAFEPLGSMRDEKGAPLTMSMTHDALKGPDFWSLVPSLYRTLMQHSTIYVSQGLLEEAVYVAEQAAKVASAIDSHTLLVDNASRVAELWIQSGKPDKAAPLLESQDVSLCGKHKSTVAYHLSIARMHHANQKFEDEIAIYEDVEKLLHSLSSPSYFASMESFLSSVDSLAKGVSALALDGPESGEVKPTRSLKSRSTAVKAAPKTTARTNSRTTRKAPLKSAPKAVPSVQNKALTSHAVEEQSISTQCASLCALQADITYRKVATYLLQGDMAKVMDELGQIETLEQDRDGYHAWVRFKAMLAQAIKSISEDFTFNTLPESTIAFPSVPTKDRQSSEGVATKRPVARSATRAARGKQQAKDDFAQLIQTAREKLAEAHAQHATAASNHIFRQLSAALSHATVLLSAVSRGRFRGSIHPLYSAYMSEIPKLKALALEQAAVEIDRETMSREIYLQWPKLSLEQPHLASLADFQHDYIDIIPEAWTAISLALSEEQDEIYITRYQKGISPFVLRLPLSRHSSRDLDEEEFTFADGRREFEEIIELSDFTTRGAKDVTTREARHQWWDEREALDTKLRELLLNIENIWLGGFKGIFSNHVHQPALLARFRKSFDKILDRHLPSRQKKGQQKNPSLDPRVLELFIGLGDASNSELDFDDALTDLIYFVVDILQFNGEPNAYDEIDFDAMVVETLDALRAYHDSVQSPSEAAHTILILDKNLHMLPWESLPCLEKLSISRLPSLAALRERLLAARSPTVTQDAPAGHYILADAGGTSILNPSGDLSHTSKTIKPHLDDMQGIWTHIANRAPTEKEFEDSLKEEQLVLFFGHGSGAQYVRSKAVRRLYLNTKPKETKAGCATTFLFGCSSVHLSENGIYEPSGMLASYLTAGAPAVLGMLWDVTDKDCDRFAIKVGEQWGLWPETVENNAEPPPTVKKRKGKVARLAEEIETPRGAGKARKGRGTSLMKGRKGEKAKEEGYGVDEAVKEARKACYLRYLNGAAAVVYGIPVFLE